MKKINSIVCKAVIIMAILLTCTASAFANRSDDSHPLTTIEFGKIYTANNIYEEYDRIYELKLSQPTTIRIYLDAGNISEEQVKGVANGDIYEYSSIRIKNKDDMSYKAIEFEQNFFLYDKTLTLSGGIYQIHPYAYSESGYTFKVEKLSEPNDPNVSVTMNYNKLNLSLDQNKTLKITTNPDGVYYESIEWQSSNEKIAKVDSYGHVKAVGMGQAEITATLKGGLDGLVAKCIVTVNEAKKYVFKGDSIRLPKINGEYQNSWKSNKNNIATAKKYAKGIKQGKAVITKKIDGITYTVNLYVTDADKLAKDSYNYAKEGIAKFAGYDEGYPVVARRTKIRTVFGGYYYKYDLYRYKTNFKVTWHNSYRSYDEYSIKKFKTF